MTFSQVSAACGHAFKAFAGLFDFDGKGAQDRIRNWVIAVCVIGAVCAAYLIYQWYACNQAQAAQELFEEQVAGYVRAKSHEQLESAVQDLKSAHDQSSGAMAPYFTAYEVDALIKLGKREEAIQGLDSLITSLSSSNPFVNLYKTKRALLKIDSEDIQTKEAGRVELENLAQDKKNKNRDEAQFYLGLYYYVADNMELAKKVWQELAEQSVESKYPSSWSEQAKMRLESLA
jgi:hypothetical protein